MGVRDGNKKGRDGMQKVKWKAERRKWEMEIRRKKMGSRNWCDKERGRRKMRGMEIREGRDRRLRERKY